MPQYSQKSTVNRQRGGEEDHVAIPTVTSTCKLMYHLKAEKTLSFIFKSYCINGLMNQLYLLSEGFFPKE
jgi:hypothetical protein